MNLHDNLFIPRGSWAFSVLLLGSLSSLSSSAATPSSSAIMALVFRAELLLEEFKMVGYWSPFWPLTQTFLRFFASETATWRLENHSRISS